MPLPKNAYWNLARAPRYSLLFALPLLLLYETLAFLLTHDAFLGVRNGADVMLKSVFVWLGGRNGLVAFGVLLLGVGGWLVARDLRRGGRLEPRIFLLMAAESIAWALAFGWVAGTLTSLLLRGVPLALNLAAARMDAPTQLMISLGAGLYEELLFRVLLVAGLAYGARRLFKWPPLGSGIFAAVLGALVFSAFHYIGPLGDRLTLASFTFRAVAGLLFSGLYLTRGFGITAWTHALYDVILVLIGG
jgi:Type II CAAX prenyl endopeptidase Rce1-like